MVNKSCGHKNALISENCIKSGIVPANTKVICFEAGLCELTFSKVLEKQKEVQKFYAENNDEKPVKMTKKHGFFICTGAESAVTAQFFKFPVGHNKGLFNKKFQRNRLIGKKDI